MAYVKSEKLAAFRSIARRMFFSKESVDEFLATATAGQIAATASFITSELEARELHKRERLMRRARFPQIKTLDAFDFSQVALPEGYTVDQLKSLAFLDSAQDFVFYGKTGRGKTHLAIALGIATIELGRCARFFTAAELALALGKAKRGHQLEAYLRDIARSDLLIIDELGYVPFDQESARLLFQVMSDCYETRSLVLTTNIEFSKWGVVFGDDKLASALIDRIVHHGRLVEFNGESKRMENALMLGKVTKG